MAITQLSTAVEEIRRDLRNRYQQNDSTPWIIGFSGGKDSTLLLHLVIEMMLEIPSPDRQRRVYVLSNDTRVESPVYQSHVDASLEQVRKGVEALGLPVEVVQTGPAEEASFWVNMLGRGYPAPNRNFRWCTDRMKIRPTTRFIREKANEPQDVILVLGVRKAESQARSRRLDKHERERESQKSLSPHNDIAGCWIYNPIVDLDNNDVWMLLVNMRPPWGGSHKSLQKLYHDAAGGECPFVVDDNAAASCGSGSARFGCWTCTVVEKDGSLEGLIDLGFENLQPLNDFRERLKSVSADPEMRSNVRRTGKPGLGPLTYEARKMLLQELLELQEETQMPLISDQEVRLIEDQWTRDETTDVIRSLDRPVPLTIQGDHA